MAIPAEQALGDYNRVTKVSANTAVAFTGSRAGAGFIVENVSNVTIDCASGGALPGSTLSTDTLYPIGVRKVTIGASGIVYVLHR
tara:strand:- start:90 stop:344 length:255 start_codon:yes stop_codon:yes gene_type:complete